MAYSPEMVSLLQQLRSRIFAEFGMKIRLVDPELLSTLGQLGKKSRDPFTRKTVVKIMELGDIDYDIDDVDGKARKAAPVEDEVEESSTMTYRGSKIPKPKAAPAVAAAEPTAGRQVKQVYRGQVIYK
ncbi:hypothetical protein NCG89_01575 [Spongiibacter taiwanensis]|uniref:hypothetical protein n=1 Tax=Spongiibacter taiwanensis TaxID=1748242 RepID=UPI0020354510|nr:hypothetical protein [Spongiibacter taiwanensis]USA43491.1 hypothetical protein NCG89_01575 [Spongiibacter taiwanensis]